MRSKRYRRGTRKWKKRNHRPLSWFITQFGEKGGLKEYQRRG